MWKTSCSVELQLIPSTAEVWSVTPVGASNDPDAGVVVEVDALDPGAGPLVGGEVEGLDEEEQAASPTAATSRAPAHTQYPYPYPWPAGPGHCAGAGMTPSPPRYGCSTLGSTTEPSGCRPTSTSAAQIRGQASADPFRVWTNAGDPPSDGR